MSAHSLVLKEPFHLESGEKLRDPIVVYNTYGQLNEDGSNVILVCHALTANSEVHTWWEGLFGRNKILDPEKYFVICINNLGSPYGTISPKHKNNQGLRYGLNFPDYTIRDKTGLILQTMSQLGIDQLHMVIGGSCGGNMAQEIAISLGSRLKNLVTMCCSVSESPWVIAIHESQRIVLRSTTGFYENTDKAGLIGLKGARAFALPFYRSHTSFEIRQKEVDDQKTSDFKAASYIRYQGEKFIKRYDTHCYYKQLDALDTHNVGRDRNGFENALSQISARTLSIGFSTDILVPPEEQRKIADAIQNADYMEIATPFGHDAFLIETELLNEKILAWLDST